MTPVLLTENIDHMHFAFFFFNNECMEFTFQFYFVIMSICILKNKIVKVRTNQRRAPDQAHL